MIVVAGTAPPKLDAPDAGRKGELIIDAMMLPNPLVVAGGTTNPPASVDAGPFPAGDGVGFAPGLSGVGDGGPDPPPPLFPV